MPAQALDADILLVTSVPAYSVDLANCWYYSYVTSQLGRINYPRIYKDLARTHHELATGRTFSDEEERNFKIVADLHYRELFHQLKPVEYWYNGKPSKITQDEPVSRLQKQGRRRRWSF